MAPSTIIAGVPIFNVSPEELIGIVTFIIGGLWWIARTSFKTGRMLRDLEELSKRMDRLERSTKEQIELRTKPAERALEKLRDKFDELLMRR